jgi:predicted ribosome quality control (RQC) complex YloA/Tae2 family protein
MEFRTHKSKNETIFLAGRTDASNESLMKTIKPEDYIFHTKEAGSPFVRIIEKPKKGDLKEAAIFCARYSRDYKKNKNDVKIHLFLGKDVYKKKDMKLGTFGVKKGKIIKVKKEDIDNFVVNPLKKGEIKELKW